MTTSPVDLRDQLAQLASGRQHACGKITAAARAAGIGAVLMIGSLGRGGGDQFSDLDLILVPSRSYTGPDLDALFGDRVLARLQVPRNAPTGGDYVALCLDVAGAVLWVDAYTWPLDTAAIPADATALFDTVGLPASDLDFIPLISAHTEPGAPAHPAIDATRLLRIAVAAKYLARGDLDRIVDQLPLATGLTLDDIPPMLHELLTIVEDPRLARAVTATGALIDLAAAARQTQR